MTDRTKQDESDKQRVMMVLREALIAAEEGRIESALDMAAIAYEDWYG
jgi:hypothetical protein